MKDYTKINAQTVDQWVRDGWEWGKPVSHEVCSRVRQGEWDVLLTPTKPVPHDWFPPFAGCRLLGLASGGGQQMPVFSLLGASCTVLDYSTLQLESEKAVAQREGYAIEMVQADMTKPFLLKGRALTASFTRFPTAMWRRSSLSGASASACSSPAAFCWPEWTMGSTICLRRTAPR